MLLVMLYQEAAFAGHSGSLAHRWRCIERYLFDALVGGILGAGAQLRWTLARARAVVNSAGNHFAVWISPQSIGAAQVFNTTRSGTARWTWTC